MKISLKHTPKAMIKQSRIGHQLRVLQAPGISLCCVKSSSVLQLSSNRTTTKLGGTQLRNAVVCPISSTPIISLHPLIKTHISVSLFSIFNSCQHLQKTRHVFHHSTLHIARYFSQSYDLIVIMDDCQSDHSLLDKVLIQNR